MPETVTDGARRAWMARVSLLSLALLYLLHFYYLYINAVDLPFLDEWEMFDAGRLSSELSIRWLVGFHNEHRILFTKLLLWLGNRINGLNFVTQHVINFLLFGGLLASLLVVKKRLIPDNGFPLFPLFMVFLLSPLAHQNHTWAFQSTFHLYLLFIVWAALFAFADELRPKNFVLFAAFSIAAMYTFSLGLVDALIVWVSFGLFLFRSRQNGLVVTPGWEKFALAAALSTGLMLILWFFGYASPAKHPPLVWPTSFQFFDFFFNIVSLGFGFWFDTINWQIGLCCFTLVIIPLVGLAWRDTSRRSPVWLLLTLMVCVLVALLVITMGRAGFGILFSKVSRYAEIGFLLIPLAALAWWKFLEKQPKTRAVLLTVFWFYCAVGYYDNWNASEQYQRIRVQRLQQLAWLADVCAGRGNGICESLHPDPLNLRLNNAQKLQINFTRNLPQTCVDHPISQ